MDVAAGDRLDDGSCTKAAGKKPAHVKKDVPGFIGNRLQHALWREAISLVEHGICDAETVDAVIKASFGRRLAVLGPLENADLVGTDLTLAIHNTVLPAIDSRPAPSPYLQGLVPTASWGSNRAKGFANGAPRNKPRCVPRSWRISKLRAIAEVAADMEEIMSGRSNNTRSRQSPRCGRGRTRRNGGAGGAARDPGQCPIEDASRSAMSARRPGRSPALAKPTASSSIR